ncbi:MAG: hypothetical protein F9B45_15430 [Phycisphaera sp. RhM]|nr:hypothetical protein [Phycisphaera sp. RhM]
MKRFLTIVALAAGLAFVTSGSNAGAADYYGHGGHHRGHAFGHANYNQGSFGYGHYGRGYGAYGGGFNRGAIQSYRPNYNYGPSLNRGGFTPLYQNRSYGHAHNHGLHLDIGRLHIGVGGHH